MSVQHFAYSTSPNRDLGVLVDSTFAPLSLQGCAIDVEVRGNCARVSVRYEYINYSGRDQRVIAAYPLPTAWDLMCCRADYSGDCLLTEYAATVPLYSSADGGADGLPGPKSDHSVWTVASQKLPWVVGVGSAVLVAATYHVPLDTTRCGGEVHVRLPAELFPDVKAPLPTTLEYAALFDMKIQPNIPNGWTVGAKCDMFLPLVGAVRLLPSEEEKRAQVNYIGDSGFTLNYAAPLTERPRNGLEIECVVQGTVEPLRFFLAKDDGEMIKDTDRYALTLCLTPQLEGRRECCTNAELVLVVDAHDPQTSAAMAHGIFNGLRGLPESVLLNVVVVGEKRDIFLCPSAALPMHQVKLDQIAAFVADARLQKAKTGVSSLNRVLRAVMSQEALSPCGPVPKGYVRHVVVVSDEGNTSYATEIIDTATRHRRNMCFSAICVSFAGMADVPTLQLLAEEGGGVYREVTNEKECAEAFEDVLSRVAVPTLTDIVLRFEEPEVRLSISEQLPAVAQGTQHFVYGIAPASLQTLGVTARGRVGPTVVEFVGKANVQEIIFFSTAAPRNPLSIGLFHLAAASARVRYLIDTRALSALSVAEMEEVRRLSETFMLPSPHTEMLQFRPASTNNGHALATRNVVAMRYAPRSWTYAQTMKEYQRRRLATGALDRRPRAQRRREEEEQRQQMKKSAEFQPRRADAALLPPPTCREFIHAIVVGVVESVLANPGLERLAALQAADGSFPLNATLCVSIGVSLEWAEREVPLESFGVSEDLVAAREYLTSNERVWATAMALASMELQLFATATMVYRKAFVYEAKHDTGGKLLRHAREILGEPIPEAA